ncbi:MAG: LPXTG cell wall anchor domain-containing protein, partial [Clostridia bacterium]|nr:LPXTG cell wall anchor domain-containing protein [Clostridia bacterium]
EDHLNWLYYLVSNTDYAIVGGNGGWWYQGKKTGLSFTVIDPSQNFAAIYVDGEYVHYSNYSYYWYGDNEYGLEDTLVVTLKPAYLATLELGEHSITVSCTNGYAPGYFYVVDSAASPRTGDTANLPLWSGLMLLSMAAVAGTGYMLHRKKEN